MRPVLPYEMHRSPGLVAAAGGGSAACGLEQEGHVVRKRPQRLHAFGIQRGLAGLAAIDDVPVLGRDDWHVHHLEGEVQCFKTCCCTAPTAHGDGCSRLSCDGPAVGVERPLDDGEKGPVGLAVVHGRTDNKGVAGGVFLADAIADVVVEDAAAAGLCLALIAGNASTDRFVADPHYFTFYTVFLQLRRYFSQRGGGIAILARTSVDE